MTRSPLDFLQIFVEFPGDLIYFLLVIGASLGALFLAIGQRSRFPFEHATKRYAIAGASLLLLWLVMLAGATLTQVAALDATAFMPPLERLAYALTMLILAWAFIGADFESWQNRSNLLVFAAVFALALLYVNSARDWLAIYETGAAFNATESSALWSSATTAIALASLLLVAVNHGQIVDAPLKLLFFALFAMGHGWSLLELPEAMPTGHYLGAARLSYAAALVLLTLIIYRLSVALLENSLVEVVLAASQQNPAAAQPGDSPAAAPQTSGDPLLATPSSWSFSAAPVPEAKRQLLDVIGIMLDASESAAAADQIVKAAIETAGAEVCLLLRVQENDYADVIAGVDSVAEGPLAGISLNLNEQPTARDAARRGETSILFPEYHAEELADLYRRLNIESSASVAIQPLTHRESLVALLVVAKPYQAVEFSADELEGLRDIAVVAAGLLAWSQAAAASASASDERALEAISRKEARLKLDPATCLIHRRDLETSLERVVERSQSLARQIVELQRQGSERQAQMLGELDESGDSGDAAQRLVAAFDDQARLNEACDASARELLEAEAVLRILSADSSENLAQIVREFMHKQYNLLLSSRDRLRRQLNSLLVIGRSLAADGYGALMQALADDAAQLELEREQQLRRLDSIRTRLSAIGVDGSRSNLTQLLIQLYAERRTAASYLADASQDRQVLSKELQKLREADGGNSAELELQLKRLSADHEQLVNAREDMRRKSQALQTRFEEARQEGQALAQEKEALQAQLAARDHRQDEIHQRIRELTEERDNLLQIRDQLRDTVTTLTETPAADADAILAGEVEALQATVRRLSQQREELALELSDARATSDSPAEGDAFRPATAPVLLSPEPQLNLLRELRAPLTTVSDYAALLLAESIGILGAAQLQVLNMMSAELERARATLVEIEDAAQLEAGGSAGESAVIDLLSLMEEVIAEAADTLAEKRLAIDMRLDDALPPLEADQASMKHILRKLLNNAGRVSPAGASITISAELGKLRLAGAGDAIDAVEIRVADAGGGIDPKGMERLFARRYRAENPSITGFGDSGVGMTVARELARAQAGDLWVTSEIGAGSVFHLALPIQLAAAQEA